jgi:(1->4)-alpha-D-glucan 1-alpha-D-glucosylmutase
MRKASREGKLWTSWLEPDEAREAALESFIRTILDVATGARFRARLGTFVERIQPAAESNSLALLALKCLAPGVPDFYQGAEDWLHTLTDPDNRRPVDYEALSERLRKDEPRSAKHRLARQLLQLRAGHPELFSEGSYEAVPLCGPIAEHTFAFLRQRGHERVAVLLRRRGAGLLDSGVQRFRDLARESSIALTGADWLDWLRTGRITDVADVLNLLVDRPVVVLTSFERPAT